jgi:streptogramin lyase
MVNRLGGALLLAASLIAALATVPASAATFTSVTGPDPSGVVRETDGSMWVANEFEGSLTNVAADGQIVATVTVTNPQLSALANGSDGRIYVASALGMFSFDPATVQDGSQLSPTYIKPAPSTGCAGAVGAVAAAGAAFIAFTGTGHFDSGNPDSFVECNALGLYNIATGTTTQVSLDSDADYLAYSAGKIWTSESDAGDVERFGVTGSTLVHEVTTELPDSPAGITVVGGTVYTPLYSSNALATMTTTATSSDQPTVLSAPPGVTMTAPHDIFASADGNLYVAESDENDTSPQGAVVRVDLSGQHWSELGLPGGGEAWAIAQGARSDELWVTVRDDRLVHLVSGKPVAVTGSAKTTSPTSAWLVAAVDPRGDDTTMRLEYGTTTDYGKTTPAQSATGVGPRQLTVHLTGLRPSTTYHFRVVASNDLGVVHGDDRTWHTPPGKVDASVAFRVSHPGQATVFSKLIVKHVPDRGRVAVTCHAPGHKSGCPFAHKRLKGRGTVRLTRLFRHRKLPPATVVGIKVTANGWAGEKFIYTTRAHRRPRVTTHRLSPT